MNTSVECIELHSFEPNDGERGVYEERVCTGILLREEEIKGGLSIGSYTAASIGHLTFPMGGTS